MRIIEKGVSPDDKTYRERCGYCKTLFEFDRKEAKFTSDQRDGDFLTVMCPTCARPVYVQL